MRDKERCDFEQQTEAPGRTAMRRGDGLQADCIDSRAILGDRDEVLIRHGDHVYRLRKTRYGKLILNK